MIVIYLIFAAAAAFALWRFLRHWWAWLAKDAVDPQNFTHYATFYGVPIYFREDGEGCEIVGRNVLFDWLAIDVVPHAFGLVEAIRSLDPEYEPSGFPFKLTGEIPRRAEK